MRAAMKVLDNGTWGKGPVAGIVHTATSAQATANAATFDLSELGDVEGWIVQVFRAGNAVTSDVDVTYSSGTLTVADGGSFDLTTGDVIMAIVFGRDGSAV